ncbi:MAG: hypothetical protein HUK21_09390 [Fibrobacteraceae bacterium]|nr:hypothetical protein [Fibrobacteraceae bacterium]
MNWPFLLPQVYNCEARLFTWEVVTPFEEAPSQVMLESQFQEEFPESCKKIEDLHLPKPQFWRLVSFNSVIGRKHRYLVALCEKNIHFLEELRKRYRKVLPDSRGFYYDAIQMLEKGENKGNSGNGAFYGFFRDRLYVLIFMEGRLCHWSEEEGYEKKNGDKLKELVEQRMNLVREFLKRDDLFTTGSFGDFIQINNAVETHVDFFWKKKDLDCCSGLKPCQKRKWATLGCFMVVVALLWLCVNYSTQHFGILPSPMAIELSPPIFEENHEVREPFEVQKTVPPKGTLKKNSCPKPNVHLQGIVNGRFFKIRERENIFSFGDSLFDGTHTYFVKNIGRDRVALECKTEIFIIGNHL